MAMRWQSHRHDIIQTIAEANATSWQRHGSAVTAPWQGHGHSMARTWHLHGNGTATTWERLLKSMEVIENWAASVAKRPSAQPSCHANVMARLQVHAPSLGLGCRLGEDLFLAVGLHAQRDSVQRAQRPAAHVPPPAGDLPAIGRAQVLAIFMIVLH